MQPFPVNASFERVYKCSSTWPASIEDQPNLPVLTLFRIPCITLPCLKSSSLQVAPAAVSLHRSHVNPILTSSLQVGHDLVQLLLNKGEHVVATARNPSVLEDFVNKRDQNFLPVKLDVKSTQDIETAFDAAITKFGRIDVLVNNAGYGLCGTFETLSRQQIRDQYDTNVFGVMDVTRRALQIMRTQKPPGGVIQQVCCSKTLT